MTDDFAGNSSHLLRVPLFPLPTVLVPGLVMPLVLFEPKYLKLAENLMEQDEPDRYFGIVKTMPKVIGTADISINTIGTIAQVQSLNLRTDNQWDLVAVGNRKFRILDLHHDLPYLTADIELLPAETPETDASEATIASVLQAFDNYRELLGVSVQENSDLPDDGTTLSYLITAAAMFSLDEKQALLEIYSSEERLRRIVQLLKREYSLISQIRCLPTFEPDYSINVN